MSTNESLVKEVEALNREWMQAYVRGDVAFLERYLAEEYVSTFPDGMVYDKRGEIEALTSGVVALAEMTPREMNVRVYGEAAVITGRSAIKARTDGQEISGELRFIDVWVKQQDRWLAVASQVTRISERR